MGGDHPVTVQSMLIVPFSGRLEGLGERFQAFKALGCDILRVAVPDMKSVKDLPQLVRLAPFPVVADIHFDHRIALAALDTGIAKLRVNPGNLGPEWKTLEVLKKAGDKGIPVRVGINSGSLPQKVKDKQDQASAMILAAEEEIEIMEKGRFYNAVFSLKSSDVETTYRANELFACRYDYPLHLGVTEAGPLVEGIVKSTLALSKLLARGIGSTLRVSLSDSEENEIITGKSILRALGMSTGTDIVSCPRCGRSTFDTQAFLGAYGDRIRKSGKNITVAVMGCTVNGPGEAAAADLGITGEGNHRMIFRKGEILGRFSPEEAVRVFFEELESS